MFIIFMKHCQAPLKKILEPKNFPSPANFFPLKFTFWCLQFLEIFLDRKNLFFVFISEIMGFKQKLTMNSFVSRKILPKIRC